MRFDDRLATVLSNDAPFSGAREAKWRQLVDLLAQVAQDATPDSVARGLTEVARLTSGIEERRRIEAIKALHGRLRSPPLIRLLAGDTPRVVAATIAAARLDDRQWSDLIPELPSLARGLLRNRGDLGPRASATLANWISADFRLPSRLAAVRTDEAPLQRLNTAAEGGVARAQRTAVTEDAIPDDAQDVPDDNRNDRTTPGDHSISELVARIERYRQERTDAESPMLPGFAAGATTTARPTERFLFLTDDAGTLIDAVGLPRGAVVGTSLAEPAFDSGPGPDASAAAAFRQRMAIENGRMRLCGASDSEGDWRISARPLFDPISGRFRGYRGIMRRPNPAEDAKSLGGGGGDGARQADSLQQLLHELRSPLNAIIGFAEIIEQQYFGPVTDNYRNLATTILDDARRLLTGFDDLQTVARLHNGQYDVAAGVSDPDWLIDRLVERLQSLTDARRIILNIRKAEPVRPFAMANDHLERIFSRLMSSVILACEEGEQIDALLKTRIGPQPSNCFILSLPRKLAQLEEADLLNAGNDQFADGSDAPILGLGFSFRLVRNLAKSVGGSLRFQNASALLTLPATRMPRTGEQDRGRE